MRSRSLISLTLLVIGMAASIYIMMQHNTYIHEREIDFTTNAQWEAEQVASKINFSISLLYQGLRTIARMPGTRNIDRYANSLNKDARSTIQELYNNLYSNISLSEVYLVPLDFDPDTIDPVTHRPSEPITTFDKFIAGRNADSNQNRLHKSDVKEIEIYEYRMMKEQLVWLKRHYPTEGAINRLDYPAISGPEVITCDNTFYSPSHPNDEDRSGIVYSVPFYGTDGKLKGMVSGVLLTRTFRKFLPNGNYALINTDNHYVVTPETGGVWQGSLKSIRAGVADKKLFYSGLSALPIIDSSHWQLWTGRTHQQFEKYSNIKTYWLTTILAITAVILFLIVIHFVISQHKRQRLLALNQNELLEKTVEERTQALKLVNKQLIKANNAKASFLSRVSHELRTPLNAIIGYSELLLENEREEQSGKVDDLTNILISGKHLLELINEVLDISKIEAGKMEINLEDIVIKDMIDEVTEVFRPLMSNKANHLSVRVAAEYDTITSDRMKLKQILFNLLSNANKFTYQGAIILSVISCLDDAGEEWIKLRVSDTGIGIDPDKQDHIFDEFYQAHDVSKIKEKGTGLGMAICAKFTELLQGEITVQSAPTHGTTFTVSLPRHINSCLVTTALQDDKPESLRRVSGDS